MNSPICPLCNKQTEQWGTNQWRCDTYIQSGYNKGISHLYKLNNNIVLASDVCVELGVYEDRTRVWIPGSIGANSWYHPILTLEPITIEQIPAIFKRVKNLMAFS